MQPRFPALRKTIFSLFIVLALASTALAANEIKVTLLGTGSPKPDINRASAGTLVEVGNQKLLFDCGPGVPLRLWQKKIPYRTINMLFLTHLHSDHVAGIPTLYLTGAIRTPYGRRQGAFHITGVVGTARLAKYMKEAFSADIKIRLADEGIKPAAYVIVAKDITKGVVYQKDGVKVTAFIVDHGKYIKPSVGYRVDYKGRSVVISGDTRYCENLIKHSKGVDLLVHEVTIGNAVLQKQNSKAGDAQRRIVAHHTSPEEAAKVFNLTKPRLAVYTHIVQISTDRKYPRPTLKEIIDRTRAAGYHGPLAVGEDVMTIVVGDKIKVEKFRAK